MLNEKKHAGEFLLSEANGTRSREKIVLAPTASPLQAGTILGCILLAGTATAAAFAGNAANTGTIDTVAVGEGAIAGIYKVVIIEPATNGGKFQVEDPNGKIVGTGSVGSAFEGGGLSFTVGDGSTDFSAGEGFNITVAAGSGEYVAYDEDATDGSNVAAGILYAGVPASEDPQTAVAIVRDAEVAGVELIGLTNQNRADLSRLGVQVR